MTARKFDVNGFFEVKDNPISREGVFPYSGAQIGAPEPGRIYQVYRPAEELSAAETLDSFRMVPIIDDHRMLGEGGVPAEDAEVAGTLGENIQVVDGVMTANLKIYGGALAEKIKNGKTELSCGYRCFYEFTPGVWNGQAYDAVQRQIRGNHVAVVDEGRMGPSVAILDQMTFTVDAKEQKPAMDEEIKQALAAIAARLDKLEAAEVAEASADEDMTAKEIPGEPVADAETGTTEAEVAPEAEKAAAGSTAMDALTKEVRELRAKVATMDAATVVKTIARKTELANRIADLVGTFDHGSMDLAQVVGYGIQKLGLKGIPKGGEEIALDAALQVRAVPVAHVTADAKERSSLGSSIATYAGKA